MGKIDKQGLLLIKKHKDRISNIKDMISNIKDMINDKQ